MDFLPKGITLRPVLTRKQELIRRMIIDEGLTVEAIAGRLNVNLITVKNHFTSIYKAYKVKGKFELLYQEYDKLREKTKGLL